MFIRTFKQKDKKTGRVYENHKLVESIRTEKGPRQRVIMSLGTLTIPKIDWPRLAHALECRIRGQKSLLQDHDVELEQLALKLVSNNSLSKSLEVLSDEIQQTETPKSHDSQALGDLETIKTKETRSLGAEVVCMKAWDLLGFSDMLRKLKFSTKSVSLAMVLIFGRLVSPGSERQTIEWFRKRSALQEIPGMADLRKCGKDRFYNVADELYAHKDRIESMLFQKEREIFPHTESTVFLFDITNTYLEGSALNNSLAARGHCKSKRSDCPLITLSLIVGDDGLPICSQIYKGNQSEPETMERMLRRLSEQLHGNQIPIFKPTVVMDRGIATEENVRWLHDNEYHYILIRRSDCSNEYRELFETKRDEFELVKSKRSVHGDMNSVYVRKEVSDDGNCRVLCFSEGKGRKEQAIASGKKNPFLEAIAGLRSSITKGTIKDPTKIENKLKQILDKFPKIGKRYDVTLDRIDKKITGISFVETIVKPEPLHGCYVIETSHAERSGKEIWKLYMTLTRVESAFRSMKETLGLRPVYHQRADRSAAHLFLAVLAYHLLATIENILTQQGDTRTWKKLREVLSTLTRGTVAIRDAKGAAYHVRVSNEPEDVHHEILSKLKIPSLPKRVISKIDTL